MNLYLLVALLWLTYGFDCDIYLERLHQAIMSRETKPLARSGVMLNLFLGHRFWVNYCSLRGMQFSFLII